MSTTASDKAVDGILTFNQGFLKRFLLILSECPSIGLIHLLVVILCLMGISARATVTNLDTPFYPHAPASRLIIKEPVLPPFPPFPSLSAMKLSQSILPHNPTRILTNAQGVAYALIVGRTGVTNYLEGNYIPAQFSYISCGYGVVSYSHDFPQAGACWFFTTNSPTGQPLYFLPQPLGYTYVTVNLPVCMGQFGAHFTQ